MVPILVLALIEAGYIGLIALCLNLLYLLTRSFYLALGAWFSVGGYLFFYIVSREPELGILFPLLGATGVTGALALLLEILIFEPFYRKRSGELVLLMVSLMVYTLLTNLLALKFGTDLKFLNLSSEMNLPFSLTWPQGLRLLVSYLLMGLFIFFSVRSQVGLKIRAIGEDQELAQVIGINVVRLRRGAVVLSALISALLGSLFVLDLGIDPYGSFDILLLAITGMLLGGLQFPFGALMGSLAIVFLKHLFILIFPIVNAVIFSLLFLALIFRAEKFRLPQTGAERSA